MLICRLCIVYAVLGVTETSDSCSKLHDTFHTQGLSLLKPFVQILLQVDDIRSCHTFSFIDTMIRRCRDNI